MRLLVGGFASIVLWDIYPNAAENQRIDYESIAYTYDRVVTSLASSSEIYPCPKGGEAIGPFFAAAWEKTPENRPTWRVPDEVSEDLNPPVNPYVRSFWLNAPLKKDTGTKDTGTKDTVTQTTKWELTHDKLKYNNYVYASQPNDVLILSRGTAIAWTDGGTSSLHFSTVASDGSLSQPHPGYAFQQGDNNSPARPGQILESDDDKLYVLEPVTRRVYTFEIQWPASASTSSAVKPPTVLSTASPFYQFPTGSIPCRATLDPKTRRIYVLTEDGLVWEINPSSANAEPVKFYEKLTTEEFRKKNTANARVGGEILWTEYGLVVSTSGVKKVDSTLQESFHTVPINAKDNAEPHNQEHNEIEALTLSPDGKYLIVGFKTPGIIRAFLVESGKMGEKPHLTLTKVIDHNTNPNFAPIRFAWLGDCEK